MTTDPKTLAERLRDASRNEKSISTYARLCREAADALEALSVQPEVVAVAVAWQRRSFEYGELKSDWTLIAGLPEPNEPGAKYTYEYRPLYASPIPASGMVMVPREPTGAMAYAGEMAGMAYLSEAKADVTIKEARPFITAEIYKAMIAAAVPQASMPSMGEKDGEEKM